MSQTNSHRFMFLRQANSQPIGCLAIRVLPATKNRNPRIQYNFSVLNPLDRFNRSLARSLALGRMVEKPVVLDLPNSTYSLHEIATSVMKSLRDDTTAPTRARKAARLWLSKNPSRNPNDGSVSLRNETSPLPIHQP